MYFVKNLLNLSTLTKLIIKIPKRYESSWKIIKLNHLAIATHDLEKSTKFYRDVLKAKVSKVQSLPEHGVHTVFVEFGNTKFELLRSLGKNSPIQGFLDQKKHGGMHHICIEVDNIDAAIKDLVKNKIRLLSEKRSQPILAVLTRFSQINVSEKIYRREHSEKTVKKIYHVNEGL